MDRVCPAANHGGGDYYGMWSIFLLWNCTKIAIIDGGIPPGRPPARPGMPGRAGAGMPFAAGIPAPFDIPAPTRPYQSCKKHKNRYNLIR